MFTSAGAFSFLRYASLLLILLTTGLLTWHRYGMNTVYDVSPNRGFAYEARDDRFQGGESVASLERVGDAMALNCQLSKKYQWPYCETEIFLAKMPEGIDLTGYDSIRFNIDYAGPAPHTVRFYLRNFEPEISKVGVLETLKVNEAEFPVPENGEIEVPIKLFRIASWWAVDMKAPLMSTDMRIDKVSFVQLSTGSFVEAGKHTITIKSIRFHGKWISQIQLVMALAGAWFMFGIIWLIMALQYFRTSYIASRTREVQLQSINLALKLETKELAGQARTDPLTGALNREGLREFLMNEWMGKIPAEPPLSILFADLDHFKRINDEHGHAVGDQVLQEFTRLVQGEIRSHDRLVRWGGEEFLILCQDTRDYQGRGLAEKLRAELARHAWPGGLAVTASFGVTMHVTGEDFGDMLLRADRALYQAKDGGRNRVEVI
jgi:diguanylate cyclase (GGDEF)-like protein